MNRLFLIWCYSRSAVLTTSLIATLATAIVGAASMLDRQRPPEVRAAELSYLPKGEYLKVAALGYRQIIADLLWLKVVQHFGVRQQTMEGYLWTYKAVDILTDLDPKFIYAYQAAGTVLAISAQRVHESVSLLEKGMRHNPDAWVIPFLLGYDHYFELHDVAMASKYFRMAAVLPGSPKYLPHLAAKMTVMAGNPDVAYEFLQRLYHEVGDEHAREGLAKKMKEVIVERDIRFLEEGIRRYRAAFGKPPIRLEDLVKREIIVQIPAEPSGGTYELNGSDGTVKSTRLLERMRLYK